MRVSVHAIVMRPKGKEAEELLPRARELAEQIRASVVSAKTTEEMMALASAKSKDSGKLEVKVEALSPVTSDGRVPDGTSFDAAYVAGLFALANVGDTSPVVESSFGFHVIRYVELLPEKRLSADERRKLFGPEVNARRARSEIERTLTALRASREVSVSPAAPSILDSIDWGKK
jgi:parvulin-like peptidyl-prolyl isomerase